MGYPPFLAFFPLDGYHEWDELPEELKPDILLANRQLRGDRGLPCIWLTEDGKCRHYEHRPQICRDFEVGGESCLSYREKFAQRNTDQRRPH